VEKGNALYYKYLVPGSTAEVEHFFLSSVPADSSDESSSQLGEQGEEEENKSRTSDTEGEEEEEEEEEEDPKEEFECPEEDGENEDEDEEKEDEDEDEDDDNVPYSMSDHCILEIESYNYPEDVHQSRILVNH